MKYFVYYVESLFGSGGVETFDTKEEALAFIEGDTYDGYMLIEGIELELNQ